MLCMRAISDTASRVLCHAHRQPIRGVTARLRPIHLAMLQQTFASAMQKRPISSMRVCLDQDAAVDNETPEPLPPKDEAFFLYDKIIHDLLNKQYGTKQAEMFKKESNRRKLALVKPPAKVVDFISTHGLGRLTGNRFTKGKARSLQERDVAIDFPHMSFFAGAQVPTSIPSEDYPEVTFIGRSNVGKSTLINAITRSSIARTMNKPGVTQQINFYHARQMFNLVDMPGYGFAYAKEERRDRWQDLVDHYFTNRSTLRRVFVLIDARTGFKVNDAQFLARLDRFRLKYNLVMTKCDEVPRTVLASRFTILSELPYYYQNCLERVFMVSAKKDIAVNELRKEVLHLVGQGSRIRTRGTHINPKSPKVLTKSAKRPSSTEKTANEPRKHSKPKKH